MSQSTQHVNITVLVKTPEYSLSRDVTSFKATTFSYKQEAATC